MCKNFQCINLDEDGHCPDTKALEGWTYCTGDSCLCYGECSMCKREDKCYEDTGLTPEEIMDGKLLTGWIPVEEKLPEDGTYLCTFDGDLCGLDEPFTGMCGIEVGKWDEEDCVLAWMPMPEPYREDKP